MAPTDAIPPRTAAFLESHGLRGETVVVAVSGGPDSLALLVALATQREEYSLSLHVAHLDHGLRAESQAEAVYVRRVCHRLGIPVTIGRVDVAALQAERKLTLEEAARHARYTFLGTVAQRENAAMVLTGHTADDQAETVLMHILRGTGLNGLQGMRPVTSLSVPGEPPVLVGRPLLNTSRAETVAYCHALRLRPRHDPSNQDRQFLRNRVRLDTLPALEAAQPGARDALLGLAEAASAAQGYLEQEVDSLWPGLTRQVGGALYLDRAQLVALHPSLRAEVFRRAARELVGEPLPLEHVHFKSMDGLLSTQGEKALDLPQGLRFTLSFQNAVMSVGEPPCPLPLLTEGPLAVPGLTRLGGWTFLTVHREDGFYVEAAPDDAKSAVIGYLPYPLEATIPHADAAGGFSVRRRRPGDRVPMSGGRRKVQDILVDTKIPRGWRDRVPVLVRTDTDAPLWAIGAQRPPTTTRMKSAQGAL